MTDHLQHMVKHKQSAAAVVELIRQPAITRADLIRVADKHGAPFKTVVKELERLWVIPLGTYDEIIGRSQTVRAFRERVQETE